MRKCIAKRNTGTIEKLQVSSMSFSGDVKEELAKKIPQARHCQIAELVGLFHYCGQIGRSEDGGITLGFATEREAIVRKGFTLLKKTFNIYTELRSDDSALQDFYAKIGDLNEPINSLIIKNPCCQRAFLRGVFLAVGSINDPAKGYHMEFVCPDKAKAEQLKQVILNFGIESKIIIRRNNYVVYLKEGESIADLLNVIEAVNALMEMENARIYKEVNNSVNRRINCEMSNIRKIVESATRQKEDILYIKEHYGIDNLPEPLAQMAYVRLEYPEAPLQELGEQLDPPVGKSGVNHRLRRLSEFAEKLREGLGDAQHPEEI